MIERVLMTDVKALNASAITPGDLVLLFRSERIGIVVSVEQKYVNVLTRKFSWISFKDIKSKQITYKTYKTNVIKYEPMKIPIGMTFYDVEHKIKCLILKNCLI